MSEEQSEFKVTDRRLFNPDGTPREMPQEEATATAAAAPAQASVSASSATQDEPAASAATASSTVEPDAAPAADAARPATAADTTTSESASAGPDGPPADETLDEGDIPGANDPASFVNFLMSIASNAAASLGMMEHPVTGERGLDLELGKHWIDVLGMLQEKTKGNLSTKEQQLFTGLLSDLRMQFVSLTRAATQKRPGGFTGSDILGGK